MIIFLIKKATHQVSKMREVMRKMEEEIGDWWKTGSGGKRREEEN